MCYIARLPCLLRSLDSVLRLRKTRSSHTSTALALRGARVVPSIHSICPGTTASHGSPNIPTISSVDDKQRVDGGHSNSDPVAPAKLEDRIVHTAFPALADAPDMAMVLLIAVSITSMASYCRGVQAPRFAGSGKTTSWGAADGYRAHTPHQMVNSIPEPRSSVGPCCAQSISSR